MPTDQKYVVLPIDSPAAALDIVHRDALNAGTFFVVKSSDIFAPAALHGYAHIIQSALELDSIRPFLQVDEVIRLRDLADSLVQRATDWQTHSRKVPD